MDILRKIIKVQTTLNYKKQTKKDKRKPQFSSCKQLIHFFCSNTVVHCTISKMIIINFRSVKVRPPQVAENCRSLKSRMINAFFWCVAIPTWHRVKKKKHTWSRDTLFWKSTAQIASILPRLYLRLEKTFVYLNNLLTTANPNRVVEQVLRTYFTNIIVVINICVVIHPKFFNTKPNWS